MTYPDPQTYAQQPDQPAPRTYWETQAAAAVQPQVTAQQTPFNVVAPPPSDEVEIKDFTLKEKRIKFKIDDDIFEATRVLGLPLMQDLVKVTKGMSNMSESGDYSSIPAIFNELLLPGSAERFNQRLMAKGDDAIDVRSQLMPVLHYLLEKFGLRPTQPSSESSTGSPVETDGTPSTAGSSLEASVSST